MEIYLIKDGKQCGPYSVSEVQQRLASGDCDASNLAWHEGLQQWTPISAMTLIFDGLALTANSMAPSSNSNIAMDLKYFCLYCGQQMQSLVADVAKSVTCSNCSRSFSVPNMPRKSTIQKQAIVSMPPSHLELAQGQSGAPDYINTRTKALKDIRNAALLSLLCGILWFLQGMISEKFGYCLGALVYTVLAIVVWSTHSRIAAIVLLCWMVIGGVIIAIFQCRDSSVAVALAITVLLSERTYRAVAATSCFSGIALEASTNPEPKA